MSTDRAGLRDELRAALAEPAVRDLLADYRARHTAGEREPDPRPLYRELGRRGLLGLGWPVEHGGRGLPASADSVAFDELARAGVPETLLFNSVLIVGSFLLLLGTDAQRARQLPGLAAGERFGCVLYTEPGAGSDLASLSTTATRVGDGWRLDGVKVHSVRSGVADLAVCAARTGKGASRYQGISLFLVDMHAAGVRWSEVPSLADEAFGRVELDGVLVGAEALVGAEGEGWPLLGRALAVERTGLDYVLKAERWWDATAAVAPPGAAAEAGRHAARLVAARELTWAVIDRVDAGTVDELAAAAAKYYASELAREIAGWAPRVLGAGYRTPVLEPAYREAPGTTLSAGTSEVMLEVVAGGSALAAAPADPLAEQVRRVLRPRLAALTRRAVRPATDPGTDGRVWSALRQLGVPGFEPPAGAGGLDLGLGLGVLVAEELGRAALAGPYLDTALAADLLVAGADPARAPTLAALAAGELTATAVGLPGGLPARTDGAGGWTVTASSADPPDPGADLLVLLGRLAGADRDGLGIALVPRDRPGWSAAAGPYAPGVRLAGLRVHAAEEVGRVPADRDGSGLDAVLARARVRQAAYLGGLAAGAHVEATAHAGRRRQFGHPLREHQAVRHRLARDLVHVEALRLAVARAARLVDAGGPEGPVSAVEVLALAAETALDSTADALHVLGAHGMTAGSAAHRHYVLAADAAVRLGAPADLCRWAGRRRLASARAAAEPATGSGPRAGSELGPAQRPAVATPDRYAKDTTWARSFR